jgi:hypothetical protein
MLDQLIRRIIWLTLRDSQFQGRRGSRVLKFNLSAALPRKMQRPSAAASRRIGCDRHRPVRDDHDGEAGALSGA